MEFIDRESELRFLGETRMLAKRKLFTLALYGLRRVGKTRLLLEFIGPSDLYFFVNKNKESSELLKEYETILRDKQTISAYEKIENWDMFFDILFKRFRGIVVFDEFQNFNTVAKSVFGILQKGIDINEKRKDLLLIASGSLIGLLKNSFQDSKEPLYGRLKRELFLSPLSFKETIKMCRALGITNFEEMIRFYAVFGGFPRYYVAIEDENLKGSGFGKIMDRFFFEANALFEEEVSRILSLEFGRRAGTYYSILSAVATGNNRLGEIAAYMRRKETSITRQVYELVDFFQLLVPEKPLFGKKSLFHINHPLINFWFRFFYKGLSDYMIRNPDFIAQIKADLNSYTGRRFEVVCREFLEELAARGGLPFKFTRIGRQWGKIPGAAKGKDTYEIDLMGINPKEKKILFAECKWRNSTDAKRVFSMLQEKAKSVDWQRGERKEYYAIFAKSFKKKPRIKNLFLFDLRDMEKWCQYSANSSDKKRVQTPEK